MRTLLIAAVLAATAGHAAAKECYEHVEDPTWSILVNDPGVEPEWVWTQGDKAIGVSTTGAGTGIPTRVAWTEEGEAGRYMFYKGALILDMDVYEPVACK